MLAEFSYASGDRDSKHGRTGTFDSLSPTNHLIYGVADLVGLRNIEHVRGGAECKPYRKLKLAADYHAYWLANRYDHFYNAAGAIAVRVPRGGALSKQVGREADLYAVYTVSGQMGLGAGYGYLFPGRFLKQYSPGSGTSYPYVFLDYKF